MIERSLGARKGKFWLGLSMLSSAALSTGLTEMWDSAVVPKTPRGSEPDDFGRIFVEANKYARG